MHMHSLREPTVYTALSHLVVEALVAHVAEGVPVLGTLLVACGQVALQLARRVQVLLSDEDFAVF